MAKRRRNYFPPKPHVLKADGSHYIPSPSMRYEAAKTTRETRHIEAISFGPNDDVTGADLANLRNRCRYILQNWPSAVALLEHFTRRVVSGGLRVQARMRSRNGELLGDKNDELERVIKEAWRANPLEPWTGFTSSGLSFKQAARLAFRTWFRDGEVFLVANTNQDPRRKIAREWQIIEADQLADTMIPAPRASRGRTGRPRNEVIQGVETNSRGRVVAYHFFNDGRNRDGFFGNRDTKRIQAHRVIHWFRPDRPGQLRGIPELAKVILALADTEEFQKAKIQAEWVANAFAAIVMTDDPEYGGIGSDRSETDDNSNTEFQKDIAPGTIQTIPTGDQIDFSNPNRPGGDIEGFMRVYHRAIASANGISYEEFTRDFTRTNYSSARAALQESKFTFNDLNEDFDENLIEPIYRDAVDQVTVVHDLISIPDAADQYAHVIQHPQPGWVDPKKEAEADIIAIENKLTTRTAVTAARGHGDFRENAVKLKEEEDFLESLGLDADSAAQQAMRANRTTSEQDEEAERNEEETGNVERVLFAD